MLKNKQLKKFPSLSPPTKHPLLIKTKKREKRRSRIYIARYSQTKLEASGKPCWRSSFLADAAAAPFGTLTAIEARQTGQLDWELSHVLIQEAWKECLHTLSCFTSAPSTNTDRHTGHSLPITSLTWVSFSYLTSETSSLLLIFPRSVSPESLPEEGLRWRRRKGFGGHFTAKKKV